MGSPSDGAATYVFVIRGELDERYGYLFEGMEMQQSGGATVIVGAVRDRAAFFGLVDRIQELGLDLLSAQQAATSPRGSGRERDEA